MCFPGALPIFGMIGSVVQGFGAKAASDQEAANLQAQSDAQKRQAALTQTTGAYKAQRKQEEVQRVLGQNRAAFSASGVALSGSPELVIEDSATEGALDVAAIRWNSGMEADTQRTNSRVSAASSAATKAAGPIAFLTPVLGGVAKFGSSFG